MNLGQKTVPELTGERPPGPKSSVPLIRNQTGFEPRPQGMKSCRSAPSGAVRELNERRGRQQQVAPVQHLTQGENKTPDGFSAGNLNI